MKEKIRFSDPACYNVTIEGKLSQDTLEIIANFFEGKFTCEHTDKITHLKGIVKDQVALSGLLIYLCDLHRILLSVTIINK